MLTAQIEKWEFFLKRTPRGARLEFLRLSFLHLPDGLRFVTLSAELMDAGEANFVDSPDMN